MIKAIILDPSTRTLTGPTGEAHLSNQKSRILERLIRAKGGVVSRDQIVGLLYPNPDRESEHSYTLVNVLLTNLRKDLASVGADGVIGTVYKTGWLVACTAELMTAESAPILQELLASHPDRDIVRRFRATARVT